MIRRLPWTIWLHLSWDLWRLVLLTASVLVTVIAFAAAVKPLADGKLGPLETVKFMLLAMPPMLQYALPFAACFGATLAYHRWAADNEITACHAGGISHRALIVPALAAALLLSGVVLLLSNLVIPRFLRQMAELVSQDVSKLIVHSIDRGEAVRLGDRMLFADVVIRQGPDPEAGAFERLWLGGLLVVKLDKNGAVEEQASAREASIWLRRVSAPGSADTEGGEGTGASERSMTEIVILPRDAIFERKGVRGELGESIKPILIPNTFADNPKYLSAAQLRSLWAAPEQIDSIDRRRRDLALTMAQRMCIDQLRASLRARGFAELNDVEGRRVVIRATDLRPVRKRSADGRDMGRDPNTQQVFVPRGGGARIVVEQTVDGGRIRRQEAGSAVFRIPRASAAESSLGVTGTDLDGAARVLLNLDLLQVTARELDEEGELIIPDTDAGAAIGSMSEWTLNQLSLADDPAGALLGKSTWALIDDARARAEARPIDRDLISRPLAELSRKVDDLLREAFSKGQERFAMAGACLVMVLIGAVMAMRLRDSLPLTIYLWAFFPALAAVISINAGQQLTHSYGATGLLLLWGGVAALGGYGIAEFVRLSRN